jgi:hypothetical protein
LPGLFLCAELGTQKKKVGGNEDPRRVRVRTLQPSPHQPDEVLFADDVVSFAQANGLWSPPSSSLSANIKNDEDHSSFDISDVGDPVR